MTFRAYGLTNLPAWRTLGEWGELGNAHRFSPGAVRDGLCELSSRKVSTIRIPRALPQSGVMAILLDPLPSSPHPRHL